MTTKLLIGVLIAIPCIACGADSERANDGVDGGQRSRADAGDNPHAHESLEVLAEGQEEPYALAIDERYVYWTGGAELKRAPLAGGKIATLATGLGLRRVIAAAGAVFFSDGQAGTVSRIDREGGTADVIGMGVWPEGVAVHDGTVFWANGGMSDTDGTLAMAQLDGTSASVLLDGLFQPSGVATDDEFLYFTSTAMSCGASSSGPSGCRGGGVTKIPLAGGDPVVLDAQATPLEVVVGERGVYWMATPRPRVMFAPFDGAAMVLAEIPGEDPGPIAVDAEALYFSSSSNGRVMKLSLEGGEPQPLVTDLGTVGGIAVDSDWVYVAATSEGTILRVVKDGSASKPTGPITGPCPDPLGSTAEVAATPRQDAELELLALHLDQGKVAATQETYERVVADVTAIRKLEPTLNKIGYRAGDDGQTLLLGSDEKTFQVIEADQYSAWDCLNDFYGLESVEPVSHTFGNPYVLLKLKGRYDLALLGELYRMLPGIKSSEPNASLGDGPSICALRDGSTIDYVVDDAGGDCPAGCTTHEAHHFRSAGAGEVEAMDEVWSSQDDTPAPEWFSRVCRR